MSKSPEVVSAKVFFGYGLLGLPLALLAITFFVYLPKYYSDVVGLSLGAIGTILLVSRIWDAVTDPLIGNFTDRTNSRWGRRRPWIFVSVFPLALFFGLLLVPDLRPEYVSLSFWFGCNAVLFFLFWTMVSVPYEALGAEISFDYKERTRLLGFRDGAVVLGTLMSGIIPWVLFSKSFNLSQETGYVVLAVLYALVLVLAALLCVRCVGERAWEEHQRPKEGLVTSIRHVLSNRPFRILLVAYTISAFGAGLPPVLMPFYVDYVLGVDDVSMFLALYFFVGFICLPFWIKLAGKIGKKESWIIAMLVNTGVDLETTTSHDFEKTK